MPEYNLGELPAYSYNSAGIKRLLPPALDKRCHAFQRASLWVAEYAEYSVLIPSYEDGELLFYKTRRNTTR